VVPAARLIVRNGIDDCRKSCDNTDMTKFNFKEAAAAVRRSVEVEDEMDRQIEALRASIKETKRQNAAAKRQAKRATQ
jgi:hypothetical protein